MATGAASSATCDYGPSFTEVQLERTANRTSLSLGVAQCRVTPSKLEAIKLCMI